LALRASLMRLKIQPALQQVGWFFYRREILFRFSFTIEGSFSFLFWKDLTIVQTRYLSYFFYFPNSGIVRVTQPTIFTTSTFQDSFISGIILKLLVIPAN